MIQEHQIRILPEQAANEQNIKLFISKDKGIDARTIKAIRVLKRSIDARQRTIFVNLKVRLYINELPQDEEFVRTEYQNVEGKPQVIVVGAGPGGLFAALRLIEHGLRPIVVERGKNVRDRKVDIAKISREHKVDPESNYSFGEGGAGAYSDGKLYTRSKKRGNVDKILNVFCQHGASTSILVDAHPHIGTDKLPRVIENMRNKIIECGGEVHFETRMDALVIEKEKMEQVKTAAGRDPIMRVEPFIYRRAGIVSTGNEVFYGRIKDEFTPVVKAKLEEYGAEVAGIRVSDDRNENIEKCIRAFIDEGCDLVVCTGGMSVDPDDRTPLAIRNVCGSAVTYGAPVLPGAMFLLAYYGNNIPIMGLPGCVMYAKRTIFDLVLPRMMAGEVLTAEDFQVLGEGGLCLSCPTCTFPNCGFGK
jgi:molybdenum cofactor synthesis domain-containing protein